MRSNFAWLFIVSIPAVLVATAPFAPTVIEKARQTATETMEKNDQAEGRFTLWDDAIEVGLGAGMLGLGPGPHLVTKIWKQPPPEKNEAHNTILDLFTQGGVLASIAFIWITWLAFASAYKIKYLGLMLLVLSLFIFSNFHLISRHPIFWFAIALCLVAADTETRKSPRRDVVRRGDADQRHSAQLGMTQV